MFGFPVRVHPFFWLVAFFLGMSAFQIPDLRLALSIFIPWVAALFVSILCHELGHAFTMRAYGFRPWITLHGFGGLASYDPSGAYGPEGRGPRAQILISLAGPGAGFLLAGIIIGLIYLSGHQVLFELGGTFGITIDVPLLHRIGSPRLALILTVFSDAVVRICILWGALNLLPIYPLDGGHVSREFFLLFDSRDGIRQSLIVSIAVAAGLAIFILVRTIGSQESGSIDFRDLLIPAFFGYMAYSSYQTLQRYTSQRPW